MKNYFEIVPLANLPESKSLLTYWSTHHLLAGQVVEVGLKGKKTKGVVIGKTPNAAKLKFFKRILPIEQVVTRNPAVSENQIVLLRWLANYYFASLSKTFRRLLPLNFVKNDFPSFILTKNSSGKEKPLLLLGSLTVRLAAYGKLIQKALKTKKQVLIIFPDLESLKTSQLFLGRLFKEKLSTYFYGSPESSKNQVWQDALTSETEIFLTTRQGLFLPFANLGLIILDSPVHLGQTETQAPTYQSLEVALKLQELTNCRLVLGETVLGVKTLWLLQKGTIKLLADIQEKPARFKIALLPPNRFFSFSSEEQIKEIVQRGGRVLVFVNYKKGGVVCQDCQKVLTCPNCQSPFKLHKIRGLVCNFCGLENQTFACPSCRGVRLKETGISIARVAQYLQVLLPQSKIAVVTKDTFSDQEIERAAIVVATKKILTLRPPVFQLGVMLGVDQMMALPDFQAQEETYLTLSELACFLPEIIIETKNINHALLLAFLKKQTKLWLKDELTLRRKYQLPPWARWIKVKPKKNAGNLAVLGQKISLILKDEVFRETSKPNFSELVFSVPSGQAHPALEKILKELVHFRIEVDSLTK